jgi:chromate transporter
MMPMIQKELIDKLHWMTEEELLDYYAIGQSTPGIVAVNVATFIGYKQFGVLGGVFATLGIIFPSIVIITILASLINSISDFPIVQKALKGINVAVAALLTNITFNFAKKTVNSFFSFVLCFCSFLTVFIFNVQSFYIIISAFLLGIVMYFIKQKNNKKDEGIKE